MKLEVGMYIRSYQGTIGKITNFNNDRKTNFNGDSFVWMTLDGIKKASHNIIDLIEKDDILIFKNCFQYQQVLDIKDDVLYLTNYIYNDISKNKKEIEENILAIVTKEQIQTMCYEVGD